MQVTGVVPEKPQWSGQPADTEARHVGVRFDVDGGLFSDGLIEDGHTVRGYGLSETPPAAVGADLRPWRRLVPSGPRPEPTPDYTAQERSNVRTRR
jgi:endonuclease YncB( thermonuclease family)